VICTSLVTANITYGQMYMFLTLEYKNKPLTYYELHCQILVILMWYL